MRRDQKGFTMLEMLVVITIILVLVTGSISALGYFMRGQGLKQAGHIVNGQFMNARQRATAEKCVYFLLFDTQKQSMRLYRDVDPDGPGGALTYDRKLVLAGPGADVQEGEEHPLPSHVEFACAQAWATGIDSKSILSSKPFSSGATAFAIAFYPDGTCVLPASELPYDPDKGASADLILVQDGQTARVYLDINTASGKVRKQAFRTE